jgi:predicted pyridoxine 5'-phosphate oxidase superfamily flavin-nucleotide-binding protein
VRARLADIGPLVIRDHMPEQHREFFAQLPFVVVGTLDGQGQPWASVLAGPAGFVTSPDPQRLDIAARPVAGDPMANNLLEGAPIGLLGIEPHTRRRNRMNGRIARRDEHGFSVEVEQSFGNCPKYIQARRPEFIGAPMPMPAQHLDALDEPARALIGRADTFFIATAHPQAGLKAGRAFGVDVSHRGGKPGFVRVDADGTMTVPDFIGNFFFNTLGNLAVNPRCGLLFMDFDSGDLLQVAARGEIVHDGPEVRAFEGAQRLLRFQVESALRLPKAVPLRWGTAEMSPVLARTGAWR